MWTITIDYGPELDLPRRVEQIPTPHLHQAIESALWRAGLSSTREGSYQITAKPTGVRA